MRTLLLPAMLLLAQAFLVEVRHDSPFCLSLTPATYFVTVHEIGTGSRQRFQLAVVRQVGIESLPVRESVRATVSLRESEKLCVSASSDVQVDMELEEVQASNSRFVTKKDLQVLEREVIETNNNLREMAGSINFLKESTLMYVMAHMDQENSIAFLQKLKIGTLLVCALLQVLAARALLSRPRAAYQQV